MLAVILQDAAKGRSSDDEVLRLEAGRNGLAPNYGDDKDAIARFYGDSGDSWLLSIRSA